MFSTHRLFTAIAAAVLLAGATAAQAQHAHNHDHGHGHHHHAAPHGGTLLLFGNEFAHLELVHEPATGKMTGYVLDGEAVKGIRLQQADIKVHLLQGRDMKSTSSVTLKAVANPLTGEKPGDSSQFEGRSDFLKNVKNFPVVIDSVTIKGTRFEKVASWFPEGNHP